ncbi:SDR family NAD(P)-dependent oxidoreductase [Curvivirga sp.]|uniref:SDR family NAD(P)-dependent oxidoreductase n=1 Tax=Curvivirga sp. TaxID=2856848 RepID=UPI003B5C0C0B
MKDQFSLLGKTAVITGGSRGIGKAIAEEFLKHGANIAIASRSQPSLSKVADELKHYDADISTHSVDVSDSAAVEFFKDDVLSTHGKVDILVNNAGISPVYMSTERINEEDWKKLVDVNLGGVFNCSKTFGLAMLENQSGSIINISSIAGHVGLAKQAAYAATKGGVEQLTKGMALDWAKKGIRVNAIAYGFVETDLTQGLRAHETLSKRLLDKTPMGRFARLEETTGAAVFLASDASSYVTGSSIIVDGGWTAE